ncbi:MAG: hypothetical protein WCQ54_04040, partial [Clostridiaceae bacterium]
MNTRFQSALNQIKADEALINKTEMYLREKLKEDKDSQIFKFSKYKLIFMKNLAQVACILLILIGGSTGTYAYYKTPVAYLSLDINPSIEFGVNAFDKVVSAEGYNADGKTVLHGIDVTGTNIEEAVSTVISSAANNGFIENDGSTVVSLTSETDNINISNKLKTEAENGVNKALKEKGKIAVIYKDNIVLAFRDEAKEFNITPGKLNLIKKLQAVNPVATVDQYREAKVKDIMKATETYADNIVVNNKEVVKSAAYSKDKDAVVSKKETTVVSKDKDAVSSKKETTVVSKDKDAVSSKKETTVVSKDKDAVSSKKE